MKMRNDIVLGEIGMVSRRGFFLGGMAVGAAHLLGAKSQSSSATSTGNQACGLTSEETIGPYYLNLENFRQNITEGKPGLPLKLRLTVLDATRCLPIENAALDIWHCDASGIYSGFTANSPDGQPGGMPPPGFGRGPQGPPPDWNGQAGPMPPPPGFGNRKTDNTTFLRGVQLTDKNGIVEFATIYPGWYSGRDIHIHLRVHVGGSVGNSKYADGHVCHTGQLFFPDDATDEVANLEPYALRHSRHILQSEDNVFTSQHGSETIVSLTQIDSKSLKQGLIATAVLAVNPAAEPKEFGPDGPGRRPFGGPPPA